MAKREWTNEELGILLSHFWLSAPELTRWLHNDRTLRAVQTKLTEIRRYKQKTWTTDEDNIMWSYYKTEGYKVVIRLNSNKVGFDCRLRARELGII